MFLYRKSYGSGLWITGPRLALGPWWTRDHGVAQPLQGSGGHRDSSEREREDVVEVLTNGTTCRRPMGRLFWTRGGEIEAGVGVVDNGGALIVPFIGP
jgi:hypothetical protein